MTGDGYFRTVHEVGYRFMPEDDSLVINRDANQPQRNLKGVRGTNKNKDTPRVFPRGKGCLNLAEVDEGNPGAGAGTESRKGNPFSWR
jgi:hypothetical protein